MATTKLIFDGEVEEIFWRFIYERQSVWNNRFVRKLPQPWTADPILAKNKFTNIYRELDPGTEFSRSYILERDAPDPDKVFNVMMYRLMCSIPTYLALGFQTLEGFNVHRMEHKLWEIYRTGEPVFGNAYLISPYSSMGSDYKYQNVCRLFDAVHKNYPGFWAMFTQAKSLGEAFKVLNSMYGFGPFLAYQVCVDLLYPNRTVGGTKILPFSQDDWARLGPGALRGLRRMTDFSSTAQSLEGLRYLWSHQHERFSELGLRFPYLTDEDGKERAISLSDMQNCLCEFSKYMNIREGSGKAQRLFVPSLRRAW